MNDRFVEVTRQSWASRIGSAVKGVVVGFVLIFVGIAVLFWNDGRAVKTHRALVESQSQVLSIDAMEAPDSVAGKLIHITGHATTDEILADNQLPVSAQALKLNRYVETFQWEETSKSEEKKLTGGGTETVTTYEYQKIWREGLIKSSGFKQEAGHENPTALPYDSQTWVANKITIGQYTMSDTHTGKMAAYTPLSLPESLSVPGLVRDGEQLYYGANPRHPQIGDQRIRFKVVNPQTYSVVGRVSGSQIHEHIASNGQSVALVQAGSHTADAMFENAKSANVTLTWILRVVGTVVLMMAFTMIFKPLSVLADVVPAIGNLVEVGTGFLGGILGVIVALVTICIAWIFYRPLVGIALLLLVGGLVFWLVRRTKTAALAHKQTVAAPAPSAPTAA